MDQEILPGLLRVDHVGLTVPDLDAAVNFYREAFGCTERFRLGPFDSRDFPAQPDGRDWSDAYFCVPDARFRFVMLQLGPNMMLELFQYERPTDRCQQIPRNCDLGGHHIALKVENIDHAVSHLRRFPGVKVMTGPLDVVDGPCAGMRIIYFQDPWGNQMELVEFNRQP